LNIQLGSKLQVVGSTYQAIRLLCSNPMTIDDEVCAYIAGIRIGASRVEGSFEPGDIIEYPIAYLPWVELPAEIRFVAEQTGNEIAEPFRIKTHEEAIALVGMGQATVQNVAINQGMIRGLVVNRVNGLLRPQMFAKINGIVPRVIAVEQPRLLDDGGASFQFTAQLQPSDIGENGLTAEIYLLGDATPLTSVAFRRADVDDVTKRIVELEARLAQMNHSLNLRFSSANDALSTRMDVMQQRIDAFIEYAASFMFDRIAATEVPSVPGSTDLSPELKKKVEALRQIIVDGAGKATASRSTSKAVKVPLQSPLFSFGWQDIEQNDGNEVRRMSTNALLFNPFPERRLEEVAMTVIGNTERPALRASCDGVPLELAVERAKRNPHDWRVKMRPGRDAFPMSARALSLVNMSAGSSGAEAIEVSELVFRYFE
jgi:hypothetical protein